MVFYTLCYGFVIIRIYFAVVLPGSGMPCGVPVWFPRPSRDFPETVLLPVVVVSTSPLSPLLSTFLHFAFLLLQYALAIYNPYIP